jgi:hypothetical protein
MDESMFYPEFARRVRRRRQIVGKSGAAVAREIGMTQGAIQSDRTRQTTCHPIMAIGTLGRCASDEH